MKPIRFWLCCFVCLAGPLGAADPGLSIRVFKAERRLEVYRGEEKIHAFKIGLGNRPIGDKQREGDGRTPEGTFYICAKNAKSRFYRSLGISYPGVDDADRGLRSGLIDRSEHDRIVAAQAKKITPPWNTPLGGEIFIHGNGASSDWTLGCIALEDEDMKVLFGLIEPGASVTITE